MVNAPAKPEVPKETALLVKDLSHAPIVYFEGAPSFGINNGIVNVTLAVVRNLPDGQGGVAQDVIAIAHLRCNVPAAIELRVVGQFACGG